MKTALVGLIVLLFVAGGCIVRPAAETILTVKQPNKASLPNLVMGLRDVCWSGTEDELLIVGYGRHPREHETYAFFISEHYPAFLYRHIRITSENNQSNALRSYEVELLLQAFLLPRKLKPVKYCQDFLYVGTTSCRAWTFFGKLFLDLRDLKLTRVDKPAEAIIVSGWVVAKKTSRERVISMSGSFDFACQPLPDRDPDYFIWEEDALELFDIPKSVLSEASRKKLEEPGYLWSCEIEGRIFYRREDVECLAARRGKLK